MAPLITPEELERQREIHSRPPGQGIHVHAYGVSGARWATDVIVAADQFGVTDVLDYGCGDASLAPHLERVGLTVQNYDPVTYPQPPTAAGLVVCADVLPFVEKACRGAVLAHIRGLARRGVLIIVPEHPPEKQVRDQETLEWWREELSLRWPKYEASVQRRLWKTPVTPRLFFRGVTC